MAKKSKSELVEEAKVLKAMIAQARKKALNFALYIGKEDLVLHSDLMKPVTALRTAAQKEAGGKRGTIGVLTAEGKEITLTCAESEAPPSKLAKLFKKHLMVRGIPAKVLIVLPSGETQDSDAEDGGDTDATPAATSSSAPETATETVAADSLEAKLKKAWAKAQPVLKKILTSAPTDHADLLKESGRRFLQAMKDGDFDAAFAALTELRKDIARTPSTERLTDALTSKDDPKKLSAMVPLLVSVLKRGAQDVAFKADAKPLLRDMRKAAKDAMASGSMDAETKTRIEAMKKTLDTTFLAYLAEEGHGPQRHEGAVTKAQLKDRAVSGKDPMTGTTTDGVHSGTHKYSRHATRFKDPGDYVDADDTIRAHADFTANKAASITQGDTRFSVTMALSDVLGSGYADKLEGVSRIGSANNPTGDQETDFTDGVLKAVYERHSDGSVTLLTMYPNPKPA